MLYTFIYFFKTYYYFLDLFIYLFILAVPGLSCGMRDLLVVACMQDLVPQAGIEPRPPALGAQVPTHWTTRKVPAFVYFIVLDSTNIQYLSLSV